MPGDEMEDTVLPYPGCDQSVISSSLPAKLPRPRICCSYPSRGRLSSDFRNPEFYVSWHALVCYNMDKPSHDVDDHLKTLKRGFEIIEALEELDGVTLSEIADELGFAESTVHRYLSTLQSLGYVVREEDRYRISFRFLEIGEYVKTRRNAYQLANEAVTKIAEQSKERAQFFVEEQGEAVYLFLATGEHGFITDAKIGKRIPLHATAGGKAILAHLPESYIDEIIDQHGLPALTNHTITERDELEEELQQIQEQGYAFNRQEYLPGSHAVGVPLLQDDGSPIGSLSVTGPNRRLKGEFFEKEVPDMLLETANELELKISYS